MGAEADFSGYATKAGLECSDGRTIMPDAFKHQDKNAVPLVWQHGHNSPENVLGHAVLENRGDGVYAYGYFNDTSSGKMAKQLVQHGDVTMLSIWANRLVEKGKMVFHGMIREVSLVLAGANPGAKIENVLQHSEDGFESIIEDEAIIHTGLEFVSHAQPPQGTPAEPTVADIYNTMNDDQKMVVNYMVGAALESVSAGHSDIAVTDEKVTAVYETMNAEQKAVVAHMVEAASAERKDNVDEVSDLEHKEGTGEMPRNVFQTDAAENPEGTQRVTLSHADVKGIVADAVKGGSLRDAVEAYALKHGIDNIDVLFPEARTLTATPEFDKRRTEWVASVINGTRHSPFSRVKTLSADLTQDEARANGYIKANYKKEEWFGVTKRTTSPTTIYKKQKLDRDDILDITDFDVVSWLKQEMRLMLEEELARAVLIGDGRDVSNPDKIKDPIGAADGVGIRSILHDHELYVTTVNVNIADANSSYEEVVDAVMNGMEYYKGTGTPNFYTTIRTLNKFLQSRDTTGRRLYKDKSEVAAALGVNDIVAVEPMYQEPDLLGIVVNLQDYNIGADRGGDVSMFDDFDIDYNQFKYLMETRLSGALTKIKSALVIKTVASASVLLDDPTAPTYDATTHVVTIPTTAHVVYKNADTAATLTAGAQSALTAGATLNVVAVPASGYFFANSAKDQWTFFRRA